MKLAELAGCMLDASSTPNHFNFDDHGVSGGNKANFQMTLHESLTGCVLCSAAAAAGLCTKRVPQGSNLQSGLLKAVDRRLTFVVNHSFICLKESCMLDNSLEWL